MNVLVSGATGLIGTALTSELTDGGHRVVKLSRSRPSSEDTIRWDPDGGSLDASRLEGIDAVVHLAGEVIFSGPTDRWTQAKKQRIMESRKKGTRLLSEAIAGLSQSPKVMVSASGINYYGSRGNELLTEESSRGSDFLADVCLEWEAAADPAREAGIRVVHPRTSLVLSPEGGALGTTLPIFKLGLGGKIGNGRQYWSWITLDDQVGAIIHCLTNENVSGPVNAGSPNPLTNAEYTKVLGEVLNRPTVFPLPAPAARLMLGEVADALLLASIRVEPAKLKETGYQFRHPELQGAFRHLLGR